MRCAVPPYTAETAAIDGIAPREISIAILPAGAQLREQIKAPPGPPASGGSFSG